MRLLAVLLLGGSIICSGGPLAAHADDTVLEVPPLLLERPSVLLGAGVFALVEAFGYPYSLGATYVARPITSWRVSPGAGFALGPDGIAFMYIDARRDFAMGERWYVTPSLSGGWFLNGDEIGPRDHLEFQSGIMFSRRFGHDLRLGLAVFHISNAGLEHPNNGTEAMQLTLQVPLR